MAFEHLNPVDRDILVTDDPPRPTPLLCGLAVVPGLVVSVLALLGVV